MSVVASVDYELKRIYLSSSTVGISLDTLDIYREVRSLRRTNESHRKYKPMVLSGGNIQKTESTFTQPYVILMYGCRIVPYNVSQHLRVIRETFSDDGFVGRDCFDRLPLSPTVEVDIDYDIDKVEIRTIFSDGGGSVWTESEKSQIRNALGVDGIKTQSENGLLQNIYDKVTSINSITVVDILNGVVDTKTVSEILEIILAYTTGRIVMQKDSDSKTFIYYKQDNLTELMTLNGDDEKRVRL